MRKQAASRLDTLAVGSDLILAVLQPCYDRASTVLWAAQAKRSASQDVESSSDDETGAANGRSHALGQHTEHNTAQHVRQSHDSKRVRANACAPPEEYVAALSLDQDDVDEPNDEHDNTNSSPQAQLRLAQLLLQRGKAADAHRLLAACLIADSANAEALCLRGKCFAAEGNHAGVRPCVRSCQLRNVPFASKL